MIDVDVVVIGAGLSGLSAAYELRKRDEGLQVAIIEAKDRVGGRTLGRELKAASGSDVWDMGGQWVGSCQPHVMALLRELRLDTYPQYAAGKKLMQLGGLDSKVKSYSGELPALSWLALLDLSHFIAKLEKMVREVDLYDPGCCARAREWDAMTLEDAKRNILWTSEAKTLIDVAVRCIFGSEPAHLSLLYFLSYARAAGGCHALFTEDEGGGGQEFKVKGGAYQMADRLAEKLDHYKLQLDEPVLSIKQGEKAVYVTTKKGTCYSCKRLIVAIPPQQTVELNFTPPLPLEKKHVLQRMSPGCITKVIVTYKHPFWRDAGYSGAVVTSGGAQRTGGATVQPPQLGPLCVVFDATSAAGNAALIAFIAGKQQIIYSGMPDADRKAAVLASLSTYFGDSALDCIDYAEMNWNSELYTDGGPVSVASTGVATYIATALRKPFNRIHFAGSESATEWCGFLNGAVQSGQRAAHEVLYNIRPQAIAAGDLDDTWYRVSPRAAPSRPRSPLRWPLRAAVVVSVLVLVRATCKRLF